MTCIPSVESPSGPATEIADGLWGAILEATAMMPTVAEQSAALEFERQVTPGHIAALVDAYAQGWSREALSPDDICGWHRQLFPAGGYYRACAAYFSGSLQAPMPHNQIPAAIFCLCRDAEAMLTDALAGHADAWTVIATLHWRFECIHPFSDGNGRVGRILVQYLAGYLHLRPICLRAVWRDEYIAALETPNIDALAALLQRASGAICASYAA